jgi:hypothetical protein
LTGAAGLFTVADLDMTATRDQRAVDEATSSLRVGAGLLVQPVVAAALAFATFPLLERTGRSLYSGVSVDLFDGAIAVAAGAALLAPVVAFLAALPLFLWLARRGAISLKHALVCGIVLANVPLLPFILSGTSYGVWGAFRAMAFAAMHGTAGALVFWAIAISGTYLDPGATSRKSHKSLTPP